MVSEVNAISEELNKHKSFEVVLISAAAQEGSGKGQGTQYVNLTALELFNLSSFVVRLQDAGDAGVSCVLSVALLWSV